MIKSKLPTLPLKDYSLEKELDIGDYWNCTPLCESFNSEMWMN